MVSDHCKKLLLCKVDTGAEGNVISLSTYKSLFPSAPCNPGGIPTSFTPSSTIITAYGGHAVGHHGTCVLKLEYGGSCKSYPFHVVDADGTGNCCCRVVKGLLTEKKNTMSRLSKIPTFDGIAEGRCI